MTLIQYPTDTDFAPAERASPEDVRRQAQYFASQVPLLRQLLDVMPVMVMLLNTHRQIVYANRMVIDAAAPGDESRILGLRPGECLACVHSFEKPGGCGTSRFCSQCGAIRAIQSALAGRQTVEECRIVRFQGAVEQALDLRVWSVPMTFNHEPFILFVVMDIADEKRREALEHVFLHDLLNVAGTIQMAVASLPDAEGEHQELLMDVLGSSSNRLVSEIRAQRELLAAETGRIKLQPQPVSSAALLYEVAHTLLGHPVAEQRFVHIAPDSADVTLHTDPALLGRVLGNMLKNALEASRPGETATLGCRLVEAVGGSAPQVEFWVHNPAVMPEAVQLQVFKRSFSTKGKGRGLGTYSIKLLSEQYLHGEVGFTSTPAAGTVFTARYPQ